MIRFVFLSSFLLLSSCVSSSSPTRFYSLTSLDRDYSKISNNKKIVVGVGNVEVPKYLDYPQIVTIKDSNQVMLAEFDRWIELVPSAMQRIVAYNMSKLINNSIVKPSSTNCRECNYTVSIDVNRFDGKLGEKAYLYVWWSIVSRDGKILVSEYTEFEAPLNDENYSSFAKQQSELISRLSVLIAQKIAKL